VRITPSILRGTVDVPPSKSQTLRALVFGLLARGLTEISGYLDSPDTYAMVRACRLLGARTEVFPDRIEIEGNLRPAEDVIDAGNSGIVLRFIGAVSALVSEYTIITGDASIRNRRLSQPLLEGLTQLGAFAVSSKGDGFAPIVIKGPLRGGTALIDGADSQPVSALLIASAFTCAKTELFVRNPGEKPWIALTLDWFERFGIVCEHENFEKYHLPGHASIEGFSYAVPGDLSSAAYPLAAALATGSECILRNVDFSDAQGDKELIFQLQKMGARIEIDSDTKTLWLKKGSKLQGAKIDVNGFIDSITILAVLGCFAEGETEIVGARIARSKESDRISAIVAELKKMGACIEEREDGIVVQHSVLKGASLESYSDHRMAMALAVAGLAARGESYLAGSECVLKSYPPFFQHLRQMGAKIE